MSRRRLLAVVYPAVLSLASGSASGASVSFNQLDWQNRSGGYTAFNSEWGYAAVQWSQDDLSRFDFDGQTYRGYVNLVTRLPGGHSNWAVQNFPVVFENPADLTDRIADGFHFNLGIERGQGAVSAVDYALIVEPTPAQAMPSGPESTAPVTKQDIHRGGVIMPDESEGGTGQVEPPTAVNFGSWNTPGTERGNGTPGTRTAKIQIREDQLPPVNEPTNHCSTGAVTRGLSYLDLTSTAVTITDSTATLRSKLATAMGTTADGTRFNNIVTGKQSYVEANNLPIQTTEVVNVCLAFDALKAGGAVEMNVGWGTQFSTNKNMGAHTAFVAEIQKTDDAAGNLQSYRVRVIDDPTQGDGIAANSSYWLEFNFANSLLGWYPGGSSISFITEVITPTPGSGVLMGLAGLTILNRRRHV